MATFGQQYMVSLPTTGQSRLLRTDPNAFYSNQTETGNQLNTALGGGYLALSALQPAVVNNLEYAPQFLDAVDKFDKFNTGVDLYNQLQMGVNMTGDQGGTYFSETFGLGNLTESGATLGLASLNPYLGMGMLLNQMSSNEENPFGQIPVLSDVAEGINQFGNYLNSTQVGGNITRGLSGLYDNTLDPLLDTRAGKLLHNLGALPLDIVDMGLNTLGEGYEFLDREVFSGFLPGGATDDDPDSQVWNETTEQLEARLKDLGSLYKTAGRKDAEIRFGQFNELQKNLVNDLIDQGVPYQLAVGSIDDPTLLAGNTDLWVSDYGRKVAEIEYSPEAIEAFKVYARDPESNPFRNDWSMMDELPEGVTRIPEGVKIDPLMGLLKPADRSDQSRADLQNSLTQGNYGNEQELRQILGDNYIEPEALDLYNNIENANLADLKYYSETDFKDKNSREWTTDADLYWLAEYSGYDDELAQETLDFIEGDAKTASERWLEQRPGKAVEIQENTYKETSAKFGRESRAEGRNGKWKKVAGPWGYHYSEDPNSPAQIIIRALERNFKGDVDTRDGYKQTIKGGADTSKYDWYDIRWRVPSGWTIYPAEPWIPSGTLTKAQKQQKILDAIPEYTYKDILEMGQDGRKETLEKLLAEYTSKKDELGLSDEDAEAIGFSVKTLANKESFEDFTNKIAQDLSTWKLGQEIGNIQIDPGTYNYNLPNGVDTILSKIDSNIGSGNSSFSDFIGSKSYQYAVDNEIGSEFFTDYAGIDGSGFEEISTEDLFADYQMGFDPGFSTDLGSGNYAYGILPDTLSQITTSTSVETAVNDFVDWLYE